MAPKQGLNIGDTDALLKSLGIPQQPKTFADLAQTYGKGLLSGEGPAAKTFIPPVKNMEQMFGKPKTQGDKLLQFLGDIPLTALEGGRLATGGIGMFTNPGGNILADYLNQLTPEEFEKRTGGLGAGPEMFLPDDQTSSIPGSDIFTDEGQSKLASETSKALENLIGKSVGDVGAFDPQGEVDQATIDKLQEEAKSKPSEVNTSEVIDTSFDSDFDADLADSTGAADGEVEGADTPAKKATVKALDEFLKEARPGVSPKTFDEYINEFGEATGLDVSGEPDTKQALMSFGLALMQNRAGKGFNISNILKATGEAGEAAMPDFRKAVAKAEAIRAKAGSYALSRKKEDQEKAMKKDDYFIIPRTGKGILGIAANLGKGNLKSLNSYELNNLMNNPDFEEQFEVIDKDTYVDLAKTAMTADGKKKLYQSGSESIPLFAGADKELSYRVQLPDMNVAPQGTNPVFIDNKDRLKSLIGDMEKGVVNQVKQFDQLAKLLSQTDITITDQLRSTVVQTARNFGINIAPDTDPVQQIKTILTRIQATNASDILQEAGKTLSDRDRELVRDIVGDVNFLQGDEKELVRKLGNIFNLIVGKGRANIESAYNTLEAQGIFLRNKKKGMSKTKDAEGDLYTID